MRTRKISLINLINSERQSQSSPALPSANDLNEFATLVALLETEWETLMINPEKAEAQLWCLENRLNRSVTTDKDQQLQKGTLEDNVRELQSRLGNVY